VHRPGIVEIPNPRQPTKQSHFWMAVVAPVDEKKGETGPRSGLLVSE